MLAAFVSALVVPLTAMLAAQTAPATAPRVAPVLESQRTDELHRDDRVSADTWRTLAASLDTRQLLDMLIAVGGYRSTSMLINSAGVQLDADMADFRFPPALR